MEKQTTREVTDLEITHSFYCDDCGKHLGDSIEHYDGWYQEIGLYEQEFRIVPKGYYQIKKHLCSECAEKLKNKIIDTITQLGFEKEK